MKLWGFDTETWPFKPGLPTPRMVCGSWTDGVTSEVALVKPTLQFFNDALTRGDHLVAVNMGYDAIVTVAMEPDLLPLLFKAGNAGQLHCVAVREMLNDIALGRLFIDHKTGKEFANEEGFGERYSQRLLMDRHFNVDISAEKSSAQRVEYWKLDGVPVSDWSPEARDYCLRDAKRPLDICVQQRHLGFKNLHDEPAQVRAQIAIQLMRTWGFRTDPAYIAHLEKEVDGLWNATREEFGKKGVFRPDGSRDTKALQALVSAAYGGNPPMTKGGKKSPPTIATDRDTLLDSGNADLERLGKAGKNDKRRTVYIPALKAGVSVPVTPEFNLLVKTGRVSSDWQQMPQKGGIREGVIARPGTVLCSLDYGGLELRTMAQRAINEVGFSRMAEYINANKSPHSHFGAIIKRCTYEEFDLKGKTEWKGVRDVSKIGNFGFGGGAGGDAIAYNAKVKDNIRLGVSLGYEPLSECGKTRREVRIQGRAKRICATCGDAGRKLRDLWLEAWPEQRLLFEKASILTARGQKTEAMVFGSRRVRGDCGYTQWLNTPFQGAGGDGCKAAMWAIDEEALTDRCSPLRGSHIVLNVHDELWIEFPDDERRHDGAFRAAEIMVQIMDQITPAAKNEVEPALMRRAFKAAAMVFDKRGRLKPWWPGDWLWPGDLASMQSDRAA